MTKSVIVFAATFVLILLLSGSIVADSAEGLFDQAVAAERSGNLDAAVELFSRAAELDPGNGAIYNNRGIVRARKKDIDLAIEDFDQAIRLDPDNAGACTTTGGWLSRKRETFTGPRLDYDKALDINREHVQALLNRAVLLVRSGSPAKAVSDLNTVLR